MVSGPSPPVSQPVPVSAGLIPLVFRSGRLTGECPRQSFCVYTGHYCVWDLTVSFQSRSYPVGTRVSGHRSSCHVGVPCSLDFVVLVGAPTSSGPVVVAVLSTNVWVAGREGESVH